MSESDSESGTEGSAADDAGSGEAASEPAAGSEVSESAGGGQPAGAGSAACRSVGEAMDLVLWRMQFVFPCVPLPPTLPHAAAEELVDEDVEHVEGGDGGSQVQVRSSPEPVLARSEDDFSVYVRALCPIHADVERPGTRLVVHRWG